MCCTILTADLSSVGPETRSANTYTFFLATYLSFSLRLGMPGSDLLVDAHIAGAPEEFFHVTGHLITHRTTGPQRDRGTMLLVLFGFMIMFVTIIVKGLLSMHSLLENPFGSHPCKFPLTSMCAAPCFLSPLPHTPHALAVPDRGGYCFCKSAADGGCVVPLRPGRAQDHVKNTVAMLLEPAQREPTSLRRLFRRKHTLDFVAPAAPPRSGAKPAPLYVSAEAAEGRQGARLVPLRNARVLAQGGGDAEADLLSPELAGRVLELELLSVEGGAAAGVSAAGDGDEAWEARMGAVLTGVFTGPDRTGGAPATVWRVRSVRDKTVPSGGRVVQAAIRKWVKRC